MKNLLQETISIVEDYKFTVGDVDFIKLGSGSCSWEEFVVLANEDYDEGYGCHEVHEQLMVIMKDGSYFSRAEYDGSEWWEYTSMAPIGRGRFPLKEVFTEGFKRNRG